MPSTLFAFKRTTTAALTAILFFATFAFGGTDPWALAVVASAVLALSGSWVIRQLLRPYGVAWSWFYLPVAIIPAAAAVQLALSNTENLHDTAGELAWWLVYFAFFVLLVNVLDDVWLRRAVRRRLAYLGGAASAVAIVQRLLSPDAAYGFRAAPGATIFGPFADAESFAFLVELLFPGALFAAFRDGGRRISLFVSCALMVAAVALSGSTAGQTIVALELVIGLAAATYAGARSMSRRPLGRQAALTAAGALAVILIVVAGFRGLGAPPPSAVNLDPSQASEMLALTQSEVLGASWSLVQREPAWGYGLGSFGAIFATVAPRRDGFRWEHGYSAPVELLVEVGAVSVVAQVLLLGMILRAGRDLRTWISVILPLAAVWSHSWARSPLQTPVLVLAALTLLAFLPAGRDHGDRSVRSAVTAD